MRLHQNCLHLTLAFVATCSLLVGCSGGDSTSAPPPQLTSAEISSHASSALSTPGTEIQSITSTAPGIAVWTFYGSSDGVVAVGTDANGATKAELATLTVGTGDTAYVQGGAYAISPDLHTTPQALTAALNADVKTQVADGDVSGQSEAPFTGEVDGLVSSAGGAIVKGGTALVKACGTTLLRAVGAALVLGAGYAGGLALEAACPETVGAGCIAGAWVQGKATTTAAGIACPNVPFSAGSAVKQIFTPTPAM